MRAWLAAAALIALLAASSSARAADDGVVGARVFVDPLSASLKIKPSAVQVAREAVASVVVVNRGPVPVGAVTATMLVDAQGVKVVGGTTRTRPGIAAHSSVEMTWRLCGERPGRYLAMVSVTSGDASGRAFRAETTAVLFEVNPGRGRPESC